LIYLLENPVFMHENNALKILYWKYFIGVIFCHCVAHYYFINYSCANVWININNEM